MPDRTADLIELRAVNPEGDLACDFTIATDLERSGLREALAGGILRPVRPLEDGVEVAFRDSAWDAVLRYVDLESRCCSFLDLSARRADGRVLLRVTGRPEARELIAAIFAE